MGLALQQVSFYDNGGGLNVKYSPTKVPEDEASRSLNVDYSEDGAFFTRNGSTIMNVAGSPPIPAQMSGAPKTLLLFDYKKSDGTAIEVIAAGTTLKRDLTTPVNMVTGISGLLPYPDMEFFVTPDDEYLIWGNGVDENLKFNGTTWTNLSMPRPVAITFDPDSAGALPAGTYNYYVSFVREVGGVIVQESELSPVATHTIAGPQTINLIVPVCTETLLPGVSAQCTGRLIYRSTGSGTVTRITQNATIPDNITVTYADNNTTITGIEADFDVITTPKSKVFEASGNRMVFVDAANPTDIYASQANRPWNVLASSQEILDGPVRCLKRVFNALMIGTDRSIWGNNGDFATTESRRISSAVGILNNRCAVEQDNGVLAILATNRKYFTLSATDFSQDQIRFTNPLSLKIDPIFAQINTADPEIPCMESYTAPSVNKVMISVPIGAATNNTIIVYNESQAIIKNKPVWQYWDNLKASALRQMTIDSEINLYSGDYNGFLWKLDDSLRNGDGAEINGQVSSSTNNTLVDDPFGTAPATGGTLNTITFSPLLISVNEFVGFYIQIDAGTGAGQIRTISANTTSSITVSSNWSIIPDATSIFTVGPFYPNALVGMVVRIVDGPGENQARTIVSNTVTTLTITPNWTSNPNDGNLYTVGGYDVYHYSNWKSVLGSYEVLKQLWFIWVNANASGDYPIDLILQIDFDQTTTNQIEILFNLSSANTIWGYFIWGEAIWGAFQVFQDRLRQFARFRAIRIGFSNRFAGQPFQINGFAYSVQNKQLFFRSS